MKLDRTMTLDAGSRSIEVPIDTLGRERFRVDLDQRSIDRRDDADTPTVGFRGHAAMFDKWTWIGSKSWGFRERVAKGAFTKTLKEADVRFLVNHDPNLLLARNKAGTLTLAEDSEGLFSEAELDTRQTYTNDLVIAMERGDINQMSFAFEVVKHQIEEDADGTISRTLLEVKLFDVSVVTYPAYEDTDAGLRGSAFDVLCRQAGVGDDDRRTLLAGLAAGDPDPQTVSILRAAGQRLAKVDDNTEPPTGTRESSQPGSSTGVPLALLKRRHQLTASRLGVTA